MADRYNRMNYDEYREKEGLKLVGLLDKRRLFDDTLREQLGIEPDAAMALLDTLEVSSERQTLMTRYDPIKGTWAWYTYAFGDDPLSRSDVETLLPVIRRLMETQ